MQIGSNLNLRGIILTEIPACSKQCSNSPDLKLHTIISYFSLSNFGKSDTILFCTPPIPRFETMRKTLIFSIHPRHSFTDHTEYFIRYCTYFLCNFFSTYPFLSLLANQNNFISYAYLRDFADIYY